LADVVASLGEGVDVAVVVVGAELVEASVGVGEEVPDDHQDRSADGDDGFLLSSSSGQASVAGAEEGVGPAGIDRGFAQDAGEVAVPVSGRAVALGFAG
jgi:hypothetical protein